MELQTSAASASHRSWVGKSGRPPRAVGIRLGDHILEAALEQFMRHGAEGATIEGIATAAGVTKRTLYARYGSKDGLLCAVLEREHCHDFTAITDSLPVGSLRQRILHVAKAVLEFMLTRRSIGFTFLLQQTIHSRPELIGRLPPMGARPLVDLFRSLIEEAEPLQVRGTDQLDMLANCLFDMLVAGPRMQILHGRGLENSPEAKAEYMERALDLMAAGFPALSKDPSSGVEDDRGQNPEIGNND